MNAILLDFGGTIDTDGVHWSDKFREAYEEEGILVAPQEFHAAYSRAEAQMCSGAIAPEDGLRRTLETQVTLQFIELGKGRGSKQTVAPPDAARRIAERCLRDVLETIRLHAPLLDRWSRRYMLALVSNFYGNLVSVTRGLGIAEYFSAIIDSGVVGVRKPDPQIFRYALDALRCSPDQVLMVGDSYDRDIVPAKSIGCGTVWLQGGFDGRLGDTRKADFTISSLLGLNSILFERITHEDRA